MNMKRINGHVVLENMPADLLHVARSEVDNDVSVKVLLHSDRIVDGDVCVYVNGSCCIHRGGEGHDGRFDVILVDNQYKAFYNEIDPDTNELVRCVSDPMIASSQIWQMAEESKSIWSLSHKTDPIRKHHVLKSKNNNEANIDFSDDILKVEYLKKPTDPIGLIEFN